MWFLYPVNLQALNYWVIIFERYWEKKTEILSLLFQLQQTREITLIHRRHAEQNNLNLGCTEERSCIK